MNEPWIWAAIAVGAGLLLGAAVALVIRRQLSRAHRRLAIQEIAKPPQESPWWVVARWRRTLRQVGFCSGS